MGLPKTSFKGTAGLNAARLPTLSQEFKDATPSRVRDRGQPTALTQAVFDFVIERIAEGTPESMIGPALSPPRHRGIVGEWYKMGERDEKKKKKSIFSEFSRALREAQVLQEDYNLGIIHKAKERDWRAAAWDLEHKPRTATKYGKRQLVGGDPSNPEPIKVQVEFVDAPKPEPKR